MSCRSCNIAPIKSKGLCSVCLADYRYSAYRRYLEKRQENSGKPVSTESTRWNKTRIKIIKEEIKKAVTSGTWRKIYVRDIVSVFEVNRGLANKIARELEKSGKLKKVFLGRYSYYEVIND